MLCTHKLSEFLANGAAPSHWATISHINTPHLCRPVVLPSSAPFRATPPNPTQHSTYDYCRQKRETRHKSPHDIIPGRDKNPCATPPPPQTVSRDATRSARPLAQHSPISPRQTDFAFSNSQVGQKQLAGTAHKLIAGDFHFCRHNVAPRHNFPTRQKSSHHAPCRRIRLLPCQTWQTSKAERLFAPTQSNSPPNLSLPVVPDSSSASIRQIRVPFVVPRQPRSGGPLPRGYAPLAPQQKT